MRFRLNLSRFHSPQSELPSSSTAQRLIFQPCRTHYFDYLSLVTFSNPHNWFMIGVNSPPADSHMKNNINHSRCPSVLHIWHPEIRNIHCSLPQQRASFINTPVRQVDLQLLVNHPLDCTQMSNTGEVSWLPLLAVLLRPWLALVFDL